MLPLLVSVPHAGLSVPPEVADQNILTADQIRLDGDEGAGVIYALENEVAGFVTTPIARAFVDLNRAEDDIRPDGVVKTETIYQESIYRQPLTPDIIETLVQQYHRPYHRKLSELSAQSRLGIDCHTMAAIAPPISPHAGTERPRICLSHAGHTCPEEWFDRMVACLAAAFECNVARNDPFQGGYIIRAHCHEIPWMQLELSRAPFMPLPEQRTRILDAFRNWCSQMT